VVAQLLVGEAGDRVVVSVVVPARRVVVV